MSRTLNAFLAGAAVGYWLGTRPREQAVSEVKHVAEGAYGFAKERLSDVRESRADRADSTDAWQEEPVDPLLAGDDYDLADEMSAESFPSSDPPSTWAGADRPRHDHHYADH